MVQKEANQANDGGDPTSPKSTGSGPGELYGMADLKAAKKEEQVGVAQQTWFCVFIALTTLLNLQVFAVESDYGCTKLSCTIKERGVFYILDLAITLLFITDLNISIFRGAGGPKAYFRGDPLKQKLGFHLFHVLDVLIVFVRAVDVYVLEPVGWATGMKLVSMLRIVHLNKIVKKMRLISAFNELWLVVAGMKDTFKVVLWVMALLVLLLWVFATFITLAVESDKAHFNYSKSAWSKDVYWGSVPKSMYSLFQVITGDRWSQSLVWPLVKRRPWFVIAFILFRALALLALLNTIVGVVVETILTAASANKERKDKEKSRRDAMVMESLKEIFRAADTDGSGELDEGELAAAMQDPVIRGRLQMLEVPVKDLRWLFNLLDEGDGLVKTDTFFRGCSRLRGPAMAMDLHQMSVDLDRHITVADSHIAKTQAAFDSLTELFGRLDMVDVDIIKGESDKKDPVLMARRMRQRPQKGMKVQRAVNWADYQPPPAELGAPPAGGPRMAAAEVTQQYQYQWQPSAPARHYLPTPSNHGHYQAPAVAPPPPAFPPGGEP